MVAIWPRPGFVVCTERRGDAEEAEALWSVRGESVAAVAFVDRCAGREALAPCGLSALDDDLGRGVDLLMAQGNAAPPASFDDDAAFVSWLGGRDYRGALALASPTMVLDRDGRPLEVSFRMLSHRLGAGYLRDAGGDAAHNVTPTVDRRRCRVSFGDDHVVVEHFQRFGLASPASFDGTYGEGTSAPFGFLRVHYRLDAQGGAQAQLAGSYLPSAWFYRDWMRWLRHDMREAQAEQVQRCLLPEWERPSGTTFGVVPVGSGIVRAQRGGGA